MNRRFTNIYNVFSEKVCKSQESVIAQEVRVTYELVLVRLDLDPDLWT